MLKLNASKTGMLAAFYTPIASYAGVIADKKSSTFTADIDLLYFLTIIFVAVLMVFLVADIMVSNKKKRIKK